MDLQDHYMRTRSGRRFYPFDPMREPATLEDVAEGLSRECRFNGQCGAHYSVAEHSIEVARLVPQEYRLAALFHDASEAFLKDMNRAVKIGLMDYQRLENKVQNAICLALGVSFPGDDWHEVIKRADNFMVRVEFLRFFGPNAYVEDFGELPTYAIANHRHDRWLGLFPELAYQQFMLTAKELLHDAR